MSLDDLRAVYDEYDGLRYPHLKATLAVLAFHANRETGRCCPSFETIGRETGVTARTAIRNVDALVAEEVLEKSSRRRRGGGGRFAANEYRIRMDRLTTPYRVTPTPCGAHDAPTDADDATGCRPRRPPADAGVTGRVGTVEEPGDLAARPVPAGPDDEPSEEVRAHRAAVLERNRELLKEKWAHA
jgi:hypothetical protein